MLSSLLEIKQIIFYALVFIALIAALSVILSKNAVRSVLSLILCFFATGGLWILLEMEFLAITLVLVYVGAVMVLFLFVVMMLDIEIAEKKESFIRYLPLGLGVALIVMAGLIYAVKTENLKLPVHAPHHPESYSQIKELGSLLFTEYLYPFEIAGILLLVAMIAAISLTFRGSRKTKTPLVDAQVKVTKEDRLSILKMTTCKRDINHDAV